MEYPNFQGISKTIIDAMKDGVTDIFVDPDCDPWSARRSKLGIHIGTEAAEVLKFYISIRGGTVQECAYKPEEMN